MREIVRLKDEFLKNPEDKKVVLGLTGAAVLMWVLMPQTKEDEPKKDGQKKEDKSEIQPITSKKSADEMPKLATISPKATPEEILAAVKTNAKTLDELYARYKKTKDPKEIKYFLTKAIIAKESGYKTPPQVAARFINVHAVTPKKVEGFRKRGIEFPMPKNSRSLLPNESYLTDFNTFKNRVCGELQPNVSEPARTNNTAEILIHSAIGMGQILPVYYLDGVKKANGEEKLKNIYDFIKSGGSQEKLTERIINRLGERYDWNPKYIAAAYYGGTGAGDTMQKAPKSNSSRKKQPYGYGSITDYVERVASLTGKIIKDNARNA